MSVRGSLNLQIFHTVSQLQSQAFGYAASMIAGLAPTVLPPFEGRVCSGFGSNPQPLTLRLVGMLQRTARVQAAPPAASSSQQASAAAVANSVAAPAVPGFGPAALAAAQAGAGMPVKVLSDAQLAACDAYLERLLALAKQKQELAGKEQLVTVRFCKGCLVAGIDCNRQPLAGVDNPPFVCRGGWSARELFNELMRLGAVHVDGDKSNNNTFDVDLSGTAKYLAARNNSS